VITFRTTFFFSLRIDQRQWREKNEERVRTQCWYGKENSPKVITK